MTRTPLSQARIAEIIDEVDAKMRKVEDQRMRERLQGLRCNCCNARLAQPTASGECASCEGL